MRYVVTFAFNPFQTNVLPAVSQSRSQSLVRIAVTLFSFIDAGLPCISATRLSATALSTSQLRNEVHSRFARTAEEVRCVAHIQAIALLRIAWPPFTSLSLSYTLGPRAELDIPPSTPPFSYIQSISYQAKPSNLAFTMISDAIYDLCLPILKDPNVEDEEKTEKLQELVQKESELTGKPLEEAVLSILWRFRDSNTTTKASPTVRPNAIRRHTPALGQLPRSPLISRSPLPRSPLASPSLSGVAPAIPPGFSGRSGAFRRSTSFNASSSPFGSPRASPRLAFASPIPHSPSLSSYEFSEPGSAANDYGDYGSDTVDWLVNEESHSRPSSSAGSTYESGLNATAASWMQPQNNEMSPYDMLRSVLGDGKTDEEIESALESNGYDLSTTLMNLMGGQAMYQEPTYVQQNDGEILIGKSMMPTRPVTIDKPQERGRSSIVCKYWLSNGNCLRADCRFSHDLSNHICKYVQPCLLRSIEPVY